MQKYEGSRKRAFLLLSVAVLIGVLFVVILFTIILGDFSLTLLLGGSIGAILGVGIGVVIKDTSIVITEETLKGPPCFGWKQVTIRLCDLDRAKLLKQPFWVRLDGSRQVVANNGQSICISGMYFSKKQVEIILTSLDNKIALAQETEVTR